MNKKTFPKLLSFAFIIAAPQCTNNTSKKESVVSARKATQAEIDNFFREDSLTLLIRTKKVYKLGNNLYVNSSVQKRSPDLQEVDTIAVDSFGIPGKVYKIPLGQREHFTLPGGVDVQADAGTTIIAQNLENNPLITIDGRATFQTQNRTHPIIVENGNTKVYLKKGIIDVMTYEDDPYNYVSVIKGTAQIRSRKDTASLTEGYYAKWVHGTDILYHYKWDTNKYTPWQAAFISANDFSVSAFLNTLQRWYKTPIKFAGNPDKFGFEGNIPISTSIKNFVTLMSANNWKIEFWISQGKFSIKIKE